MKTSFNTENIGVLSGIVVMLLVLVLSLGLAVGPAALAQQSNEERRQQLQRNLLDIEHQILLDQRELGNVRSERQTLEQTVNQLESEIRQSQSKIQQKSSTINQLNSSISEKEQRINELVAEINREQESLAELIRRQNRLDQVTLVELVLGGDNLSDFYGVLDSYASLNNSLQSSFERIRLAQAEANQEKQVLGAQKSQEVDARYAIQQEKEVVEQKRGEQQELVAVKMGEEQTYEQLIAEKKARAAEIRAELFRLRGTGAIPFGDALRYARAASAKTGVRPALILAILKQESNMGENVGTCNRPGDPESKKWYNIMKPSRDIEPYKAIVAELGLTPESRPLSCPWGNGWGGAMGPSQFIPSTWMAYKGRLANLVGHSPNPWNPHDAFHATALYMMDLGAGNGGYTAERQAALRYYAGGNWHLPQNAFYGDQVMAKAQNIQSTMIDPIDAADEL